MKKGCCHWPDYDLDDVFAYKTERVVVLRDRKLGLLRMAIILAVFIYVFMYEVVMKRGYLAKEDPIGFASLSLRRQAGGALPEYCCPSVGCGSCVPDGGSATGACSSLVAPPACTAAPGCTWQDPGSLPSGTTQYARLECVGWDRFNMVVPPAEEYSTFITTRVTVTMSEPMPEYCVLNATSQQCGPWVDKVTSRPYYTTGVDNMTIMLTHGASGRLSGNIVEGTKMNSARLLNRNDDALLNFCGGGNGFGQSRDLGQDCSGDDFKRPGDILTVEQLLSAGGVSLDDVSRDSTPRRYGGVVALVMVEYTGEGIDTELTYEYKVRVMDGVEHKFEEVRYIVENGNATRLVWNRHGVRVVVVISGQVVWFDFAELMKTVTIALSMLSIAGFIVNHIAMPIMPYSGLYKRYREIKSVDFSSIDPEKIAGAEATFAVGEVRKDGELSKEWEKGQRKAEDEWQERREEREREEREQLEKAEKAKLNPTDSVFSKPSFSPMHSSTKHPLLTQQSAPQPDPAPPAPPQQPAAHQYTPPQLQHSGPPPQQVSGSPPVQHSGPPPLQQHSGPPPPLQQHGSAQPQLQPAPPSPGSHRMPRLQPVGQSTGQSSPQSVQPGHSPASERPAGRPCALQSPAAMSRLSTDFQYWPAAPATAAPPRGAVGKPFTC